MYLTGSFGEGDQDSWSMKFGLGTGYPGPTLTMYPLCTFSFSFTLGGRYKPCALRSLSLSGMMSALSPTTIICFRSVFSIALIPDQRFNVRVFDPPGREHRQII